MTATPGLLAPWMALALAVHYQGKHLDQALARIEEAISIDPKYAHAHWDRATCSSRARRTTPPSSRPSSPSSPSCRAARTPTARGPCSPRRAASDE